MLKMANAIRSYRLHDDGRNMCCFDVQVCTAMAHYQETMCIMVENRISGRSQRKLKMTLPTLICNHGRLCDQQSCY
jgi:hypothetical protein